MNASHSKNILVLKGILKIRTFYLSKVPKNTRELAEWQKRQLPKSVNFLIQNWKQPFFQKWDAVEKFEKKFMKKNCQVLPFWWANYRSVSEKGFISLQSYLFHTSELLRKDVVIFLSNYHVVTSTAYVWLCQKYASFIIQLCTLSTWISYLAS